MSESAGELSGMSVVVTGAGSGLGAAFALAAALAGAAVVVSDIDGDAASATVDSIRSSGGRAIEFHGSVADWSSAEALIDACVTEFGQIDGLVNNAGIHDQRPAWDYDEDRVRRLVEVNVLGTIFCGVHALRRMAQQRTGVIVNVSSGAMLGIPEMSVYGATKGAVTALTTGWALEGHSIGVRVNGISPLAPTSLRKEQAGKFSRLSPEAIAPLVVYLLSERSRHLTGQVVRLSDGAVTLLQAAQFSGEVIVRDRWTVPELAVALDQLKGSRSAIGLHGPRVLEM